MTPNAEDVDALLARLHEEDELAGPAAVASNVAYHYDRVAGQLMRSGDPRVLAELFKRLRDDTPVTRAVPPFLPIHGGYGKTFGPITVGDKARFMIGKLLPPEVAKEALAKGANWLTLNRTRLRWDPEARRYRLGMGPR